MAWSTEITFEGYGMREETLTLPTGASTDVSSAVIDFIPKGRPFIVVANTAATDIGGTADADVELDASIDNSTYTVVATNFIATIDAVTQSEEYNPYESGTHLFAPYYKVRLDPSANTTGETINVRVIYELETNSQNPRSRNVLGKVPNSNWTFTSEGGYLLAYADVTLPDSASTTVFSPIIDFVPRGADFQCVVNTAAEDLTSAASVDLQVGHSDQTTAFEDYVDGAISAIDAAVGVYKFRPNRDGSLLATAPRYRLAIVSAGNQAEEVVRLLVVVDRNKARQGQDPKLSAARRLSGSRS